MLFLQFGVRVPGKMWPVEDTAVVEHSALYGMAHEFPAARAQVGTAVYGHVVQRPEPTSRALPGVASVLSWVCTLTVLRSMHPPRAFEPADGAVVRIHDLTSGIQTWSCVVDRDKPSRTKP